MFKWIRHFLLIFPSTLALVFFFVQPSVQFESFTQTVACGAKPSGVLMLKNLFYLSAEIKQLFFYTTRTRTNFIVVRFINTSTLLTAWHNIPGIHLWLQLIAMTAPCVFISLFLFFTRSVSVCVCMCLIWNIRSPLLFCILKTLYICLVRILSGQSKWRSAAKYPWKVKWNKKKL